MDLNKIIEGLKEIQALCRSTDCVKDNCPFNTEQHRCIFMDNWWSVLECWDIEDILKE